MPKYTVNVSLEVTLEKTKNTSKKKITPSTNNNSHLTLPKILKPLILKNCTKVEGVHEAIREDPSLSEKKDFSPDKSFKRKAKLSYDERKARDNNEYHHHTYYTLPNTSF